MVYSQFIITKLKENQLLPDTCIKLNNETISRVYQTKFLGVLIHVNSLIVMSGVGRSWTMVEGSNYNIANTYP